MPNWCNNFVEITLHDKSIDEVKDIILCDSTDNPGEKTFSLQHIKPLNTESGEWEYDKVIQQWGTKWDVTPSEIILDEQTDTIKISFESAWSPPLEALSHLYKNLKAVDPEVMVECFYDEGGVGFFGCWVNDCDNCQDYEGNVLYVDPTLYDDEELDNEFYVVSDDSFYIMSEFVDCTKWDTLRGDYDFIQKYPKTFAHIAKFFNQ